MPPVVPPASPSGATSPAPNVLDLGMSLTIEMLYAKFDIGDVIGTGAFSEVRRATERATGVRFAVKIIDKAKCRGKESMIQSEVEILKRVKHRNIIRLFEMYESPLKIFLVMELVTGGELFDRIVERGHYTESDAAKIVYEILRGVQYLHRLNICHRDLKPENLLFYDATPGSRIMISDFGLSKIFDDVQLMRTACGTPGYVAPEVLRREGYQKQVDMWSIGVITYILLCGYPPFYEENNHALFQQIMSGHYEFDSPYWDNISFEAKNFVQRLLLVDPTVRMTAQQALEHPFLLNNCDEAMICMQQLRLGNDSTASLGRAARHHGEQSNLAPTINSNLRSYSQRRSSDKLAAASTAASAPPPAPTTRQVPALASTGTASSQASSSSDSEPQMNPLRPKGEANDVMDSGLVASIPDVRKPQVAEIVQNAAAPFMFTMPLPATAVTVAPVVVAPTPTYAPPHATGYAAIKAGSGTAATRIPSPTEVKLSSPAPTAASAPMRPGYTPTPSPAPTQTRTVRALSYSMFMRVPGLRNNLSDHKNARLHHFIEYVLPQYDIVCLQEMYSYGSGRVQRLLQLAKTKGFSDSLVSPSKGLLNGCTDGGLVILSRFPITRQGRLTFRRAVYNCRFAAKGALYARIAVTDQCHLHVVTTNLQKSGSPDFTLASPEAVVRQTQLAQLRAFVKQQTADKRATEPILMFGDLNLNAIPSARDQRRGLAVTDEYTQMMRILRGEWSRPIDNMHACDEFLSTDARDKDPMPLRDLLLDQYGRHPVTYSGHGIDVHAVSTNNPDVGINHAVDYALWCPPAVRGGIDLEYPVKAKVNPFEVQEDGFTHLSDHYGVEVFLRATVPADPARGT
ncbi:CAMK/CAMK1 protein kinase [Allomyces macrogynus ATCC 38327]|uniref:sphingomyelin phosphodiesterase n=1 Tax=Allomyces macrogynus (strain ATCC 38327) TaxID=578462 RepID=A0A0L0SX20_ALLM3|nr:CAMK/CAMK1 protein kinase [Allomyces macrogynus ATCC 38327]|eukprot:KNE67098.1 CAMK/CAMK1 protein kinase [Allomyces macrogynus ATCC 38327]